MFKIIEPKNHCFCLSSINHFMELVKSRGSLGLSKNDQNRATFILCDSHKNGVCGGALLLKKKVDEFPHELSNTLSDFVPTKENVWRCMAFLSFEKDSTFCTANEQDHFCQIFYRNLYNTLVEFGKKEDTGFLCVKLDSTEHLCTEGITLWPYIFEINPQQSPDGHFHGILSLTGSQYEDYQKRWRNSAINTYALK